MDMSKEQTDEMKIVMKEVLKDYMAEHRIMMKETWKETQKEFLDEKFAQFGRWSLYGILASSLSALGYFIFVILGTHK